MTQQDVFSKTTNSWMRQFLSILKLLPNTFLLKRFQKRTVCSLFSLRKWKGKTLLCRSTWRAPSDIEAIRVLTRDEYRRHLGNMTLLRLFTPSVSEARFEAVTSSIRSILCSTEPPSSMFDVTMTSCGTGLPPSVQFAARCSLVPNCTNFDYRADLKQCQLYFYVPTVLYWPACLHPFSGRSNSLF